MKTLSIAALFATLLVTGTAQAQFGNSNNNGFGRPGQGQQFRNSRSSRITPGLIREIIGLFDDRPPVVNNTVDITGTWNETLNGFPLQHTMTASAFHQITNRQTGQLTNSHQAGFDGTNLQLLNGRYRVTQVTPGVLKLSNFRETRTWTRVSNNRGGGNGGGGLPPSVRSTGIPQQLQGIWFAISPEGTRWMFVFRANTYDMFDFDPATGQPIREDGQPVQLINNNLTFTNGVLSLSPGQDVADGPFNTQAAPDASQLFLTPLNGGPFRMLTRVPQN